MQLVDAEHNLEISFADWLGLVVKRRWRKGHGFALFYDRKLVLRLDHRFAFGSSTRPSACSKKSISSACCPIFACKDRMPGLAFAAASLGPLNTPATPLSNCVFHCVT